MPSGSLCSCCSRVGFPSTRPPPRGTILKAALRDAPDVRSLQPETPEALAHLVGRCLEKDPELRPHVLELARVLATFAESSGVASLEVLERKGVLPRATMPSNVTW
jgi:hypothetical protein